MVKVRNTLPVNRTAFCLSYLLAQVAGKPDDVEAAQAALAQLQQRREQSREAGTSLEARFGAPDQSMTKALTRCLQVANRQLAFLTASSGDFPCQLWSPRTLQVTICKGQSRKFLQNDLCPGKKSLEGRDINVLGSEGAFKEAGAF